MKLKSILMAALLGSAPAAFAQTFVQDSVAMGVGYANDVFYALKTGGTTYQQGNDWHLAFQMTRFGEPNFNASIRANHPRTGMSVFEIDRSAPTTFNSITAADTIGKTSPARALFNNDTSWGTGAFYQNRSITDPFDFGWGIYASSPTHAVNGTSSYLLKLANGAAYKFWVKKYESYPTDSISYTFQVAKLDGTGDRTVTIKRSSANMNFTDRLNAYYNIDSDRVANREPMRQTWDLLFTQYNDSTFAPPPAPAGTKVLYTVTGVLANQSVQMVNTHLVNPDPAQHKSYTYSTRINTIGYDWKTYVNPGPSGYFQLDSTANFFIRTANYPNEYYQLRFTRFDGGGSAGQGKIVFEKRFLSSNLAVGKVSAAAVSNWFVTPNPATNSAFVMIDAKTATAGAVIMVTDMSGRVVMNTNVDIKEGLNSFEVKTAAWPDGMYAIRIAGASLNLNTRLVVTH